MRPLYDDGASSATAATRDYVLEVADAGGRAPVLNVFGGKITTHRRLAEAALEKLAAVLPRRSGPAGPPARRCRAATFPGTGRRRWRRSSGPRTRSSTPAAAARLVRLYGTEARTMLEGARSAADLGDDFGAGLSERELVWLREREWAQTAEDVLWRRTKLGLRLGPAAAARVGAFLDAADAGRGSPGRSGRRRRARGTRRGTRRRCTCHTASG